MPPVSSSPGAKCADLSSSPPTCSLADRIHFHADDFPYIPHEPQAHHPVVLLAFPDSISTCPKPNSSSLPLRTCFSQPTLVFLWLFLCNRPSLLLSGLLQRPPHWSPHFHPDQIPSFSPPSPQSILHTAVPAILLTCKSDQILPLPNLSKDSLFIHSTSQSLYTPTRPYTILPVISLTCCLIILSLLLSSDHTDSFLVLEQLNMHTHTPTPGPLHWLVFLIETLCQRATLLALISVKSLPNNIPDHLTINISAYLLCCFPSALPDSIFLH